MRPHEQHGSCDDGVSCTENDQCDGSGTCAGTPNDALCDDGNQCTADSCDPSLDCQNTNEPAGTTCDDGVSCTENDQCDGSGTCAGTPNDALCDDGNQCTADSCDPSLDCQNTNEPAGTTCDDGVSCTENDQCDGSGTCAGTPNDTSATTATSAPPTRFACTTDDQCDGSGNCTGTPDDTNCDDTVACTTDTCDPDDPNADGQGCVFTPDDTNCDDGATCTQDVCDPDDPGADSDGCVITPDDTVCEDGNVCTDNACDPDDPGADGTTGCVDTFNTDPCDDGIPCTTGDVCDGAGNCAGTPDDDLCDDSDECTVDVCDPETGCSNTLVDSDNDGVCDAVEESCLSGSSTDNNQTALPTATGAGCVIVESDCTHSDVEVFRESDLGKDRSFLYLYGLVGFRLTDCPGAGASVKLTFDAATDLSDFVLRKFGPLPPGGAASQFYTLAEENPNANVQVVGNMVTFQLQDGQPGDDTGRRRRHRRPGRSRPPGRHGARLGPLGLRRRARVPARPRLFRLPPPPARERGLTGREFADPAASGYASGAPRGRLSPAPDRAAPLRESSRAIRSGRLFSPGALQHLLPRD
ncbi:MAG: hypothetical protein KatS3mg076_2354 [Candidatus Binatia bacterium]|nr:MAG: hypothetical protein KatS3mg076_2354 [Candidatus Binatia bacterium]